jgi:cytochrome c oxidase subunit I+III
LVLPAIGTLAVAAATAAMYWANWRIEAESVPGLRIALAVAFVLGAVAVGVLWYDLSQQPFDHTLNAYSSLYYTLVGFMIVILLGGLGQNLFTQVWSWFGRYSAREHIAVDIGAHYWYATVIFWLVLIGTVYGAPYLV